MNFFAPNKSNPTFPAVFLISAILIFLSLAFTPPKLTFILYSLILTAYMFYEIVNERKRIGRQYLLSPIVLASVMTFIWGFGITNLLYLDPDSLNGKLLYNKLGPNAFSTLNTAMPAVFLAAFAMWFGYRSKIGEKFFKNILMKKLGIWKFLRKSFSIKYSVIFTLVIIGIITRLVAINLGVWGYAQNTDSLTKYSAIVLILKMIGDFGSLFIVFLAYIYFKGDKNFNIKFLLYITVITEIFFGILSGMKSQIIYPIAVLFFVYFLIYKKINKRLLVLSFLLLIFAYVAIEPYRQLKNLDRYFSSNPMYIFETMYDAYFLNKSQGLVAQTTMSDIFITALMRNNQIVDAAKSIDYDNTFGLAASDPNFKEKIYTIPFQALIPRAFWTDKPIEDMAGWFTHKVWQLNKASATAMSAIGFCYFTGGYAAIAILFFLIGVLQKILFKFLDSGAGGLMIYFGLLNTVVLIDSMVHSIFVAWIRLIPILIFLQFHILKDIKDKKLSNYY